MDIVKKSVGIANTNPKLNYYEEYYGSGSNNVGLGNIWFDSHLIPSQPPTSDTPVVRLINNASLTRVNNSNAFRLTTNLNDLKYAIFGSGCINTVNVYTNTTEIMYNPYNSPTGESGTDKDIIVPTSIDYFPIITLTDGSILGPSNSIYIDHFAGLLYFNKVPESLPSTITFHKYVGRLGITQDTAVNWTNPIINYKTTIINTVISEPGAVLYYYYIRTNDNMHYKAGEIYINYNQTTAVLSDRIIEHDGVPIAPIDINNISFEAEVVLSSSGVIKLMLHCINLSGIYYLSITETETPITTLFDKSSSYLKVSNLGDSLAPTHNRILQLDISTVGVVCYYTIIDQLTTDPVNPGRLNQQAGKLNYTWSVDPAGAQEVTGESPVLNFPLIGENYIIEFSTDITAGKFNLYADIVQTDKRYTVELNYVTYINAKIITPINATINQVFDTLDRSATNYKIYKYCLKDSAPLRPNIICGEIAVVCDSTNERASNYRFTKSAGRGPNNNILIDGDENDVTTLISFDVVDNGNLVDVLVSFDATQTTGPYTMYLFEKTTPLSSTLVFPASNPSNVNPVVLPSNEITVPNTATSFPYTHTLLTLNPAENAHIYIVTATNDVGCKTTKEIAIYYSQNNPPGIATPPGTGYFVSRVRTLQDDVGDCSKVVIDAKWTGTNPIIYADIYSQVWTFATCHINLIANYSNLVNINSAAAGDLDTLLPSSNGASYYYFLKTIDGLNMRMGEIYLSFNNSSTSPDIVLDFGIPYGNAGDPMANPPEAVGDTSGISINASVVGTNIILGCINTSVQNCQVYLFKHTPVSNIDSYIGGTNSIIKQPKVFTLNSAPVLIDEFTENDKIKVLNATTVNPNKLDELMVSKILHYSINNTDTTPGTFARVGELFIQWGGSSLNVNDRSSYSPTRNIADASVINVKLGFLRTITYENNTYVYRIYATNTVDNTYNLRISPTLILSNLISVSSNVNVNINANSTTIDAILPNVRYLIKYYKKNATSSVVADYMLYTGTGGDREMGTIKMMWNSTNTSDDTVNISFHNKTTVNVSGFIFNAIVVNDPANNAPEKKLVALYLEKNMNDNTPYTFKMRDTTF